MSIWIWLKLLFALPSLIPLVLSIISFIKNFKKDGFSGIAELAEQILKAILGFVPGDKVRAIREAKALHFELSKYNKAMHMGEDIKSKDRPVSLVKIQKRVISAKWI